MFERGVKSIIANCVNRWRVILSLLLLATWLPSALPCELKGVLFPALDCCSAENSSHDQKTDCDNCQICKVVIARNFSVSVIRVTLPEIAPIVRVEIKLEDVLLPESFPTKSVVSIDSLLSWQFDLRAALPVRAPSFVS
jgi:hypothetical protein